MSPKSHLHIEREAAAYIEAPNRQECKHLIKRLWEYIREEAIEYYRAPKHKVKSSKKHIKKSNLPNRRSETDEKKRYGRNIFYLDTLDLVFRRSKIQLRFETKGKTDKGPNLKREFDELTIKIGDKSDKRIEEKLRINLSIWKEKGFAAAFKAAVEADVKYVRRHEGRDTATVRRNDLHELKDSLKAALKTATHQSFEEMDVYILGHLERDSRLSKYSPADNDAAVFEIKTDNCDWEVVSGETGAFAQIEIEHLAGPKKRCFEEMDKLASHPEFNIVTTTDSKEDPLMRVLEGYLLPKDETRAENERVAHNRAVMANTLDPCISNCCHNINLRAT